MREKTAAVLGAGGFIGSHLVRHLKAEGYWVRGIDIKHPEYSSTAADEFIQGDLRDPLVAEAAVRDCQEVYQLAADMGGMGFISGEHDAAIMHNSVLINLNVLQTLTSIPNATVFYSSSACVYPRHNQQDPANPRCEEDSAYPADPDSEYGWEKLFSERLYLTYARKFGLKVKIARFHNVFGPEGTWRGGREKAPAALCRKVAEAADSGTIEVWGGGDQTRSFLYIDECLEGVRRFMESSFAGPLNIGSSETIAINELAAMVIDISGKRLAIKNIPGPEGVRGRTSDNKLISKVLGWAPAQPLRRGIEQTYRWIEEQVQARVPQSLL